MRNNMPFSGLRVLEMSSYVAVPSCGRLLADWGADVIKVESAEGDQYRNFGPTFNVPATEEENPLFDILNSKKRSLVLNLKEPEGMQTFLSLLEQSDVFLTNTRAKALSRLGLDYDALKERFPRLVYALITGYGDEGPRRDAPGFDGAAFWASSGFLADMSVDAPGSYPVVAPTGPGDMVAGAFLCSAILGALYAREKTGQGDRVTVSLYGAAIWAMSCMILPAQERYGYPYPKGRYAPGPCAYKTSDGEWISTTILEHKRYFPALCRVLGVPELGSDSRFIELEDSVKPENKAYQVALFEKIYATRTAEEWLKDLREADIVCSRLAHFKEVTTDEQAKANGYITDYTMPGGDTCVVTCPAIRSERVGEVEMVRGPLIGENSVEVLRDMGLTDAQIKTLVDRGIVVQK